MKNTTLAIYGVPFALLVMAGGLANGSASAETDRNQQVVSGVFTYDRQAPADAIYAKLQRAAEKLCSTPGPRQPYMRQHDEACEASVIENGVSRIAVHGRTDVAAIHGRDKN